MARGNPGMRILLAVVGIAAAIGARYLTANALKPSRADYERQADEELAKPGFAGAFAALKADFPADYNAFRTAVVDAAVSAHGDKDLVSRAAMDAMTRFRLAHQAAAALAPDDAIAGFVQAQARALHALQTSNPHFCARFGLYGEHPFDPKAAAPPEMDALVTQSFHLMRVGADHPTDHAPPTAADASALQSRLRRAGVNEKLTAALQNPALMASLGEADQCSLAVALADAIADMPPAMAARFTADSLRGAH